MTCRERQNFRQKEKEEKMSLRERTGEARRMRAAEQDTRRAQPNQKSGLFTIDEEMEHRQEEATRLSAVYRKMLPTLLTRLSRIDDPRSPGKIKHKITVLMLYGILLFAFQIGSRREANKQMSKPIAWENLSSAFPELTSMPHADTLARLLEKIEVDEIQDSFEALLKSLIKKKKFKNLLTSGKYIIAVDGSQKYSRDYCTDEQALKRHVGEEKKEQYYIYVLEAVLILSNGAVLPVCSEILENSDWKEGESKQDCESKAFKRMAPKLKKMFGRKVTILGDGLYASGPVISMCLSNGWGFMLTLKPGSLPILWQEALELMRITPENNFKTNHRGRSQSMQWINEVEYIYGNNHKKLSLNVVCCNETWVEAHARSGGEEKQMSTHYTWLSSEPITEKNVCARCNEIGRARWGIENTFHAEKHDGYNFSHCYSYDWNAMKGFHYLMQIARFMNVLAIHSEILTEYVLSAGIQGFFKEAWLAFSGAVLNACALRDASGMFYWRLNTKQIFLVN
jgi:hypothetical protein